MRHDAFYAEPPGAIWVVLGQRGVVTIILTLILLEAHLCCRQA